MIIKSVITRNQGLALIKQLKSQQIPLFDYNHVSSEMDLDVIVQNLVWQLPANPLQHESDNRIIAWVAHEKERVLGLIVFTEHMRSLVDGVSNWYELFWVSFYRESYPLVGARLLLRAIKEAKKAGIKKMFMSGRSNFEQSDKLEKFYTKLGFKKDYTVYTKLL